MAVTVMDSDDNHDDDGDKVQVTGKLKPSDS